MLNNVLNVAGAAAAGLFAVCVCTVAAAQEPAAKADGGLSGKDQAIAPIAAFTARGDMPKLREALAAGLDAGLTVNEIKEDGYSLSSGDRRPLVVFLLKTPAGSP